MRFTIGKGLSDDKTQQNRIESRRSRTGSGVVCTTEIPWSRIVCHDFKVEQFALATRLLLLRSADLNGEKFVAEKSAWYCGFFSSQRISRVCGR
jgi:hypothetical protein